MSKLLLESILDDGLRQPYFFNGRLLSGEDLRTEQNANRAGRELLGRAIGDGVVHGLQVTVATTGNAIATPTVSVEPGVAINRLGQTLKLSQRVDVALYARADGKANGGTGAAVSPFDDCTPLEAGAYVAGTGVYLLSIAPASGTQGRALASGLDNQLARCNTKYTVEGVRFRLTQLDLSAGELADVDHLRNLVAYKCFGVEALQQATRDPFGPPLERYGLIDELRSNGLLFDVEVPIAVLHWTAQRGINFLDLWAVRRDPGPICPTAEPWELLAAGRRTREASAMLRQFQDHLADLRARTPNPTGVTALGSFRYLPPVGVVPLTARSMAFDRLRFFEGLTCREPTFINGARAEAVLREALPYAPIELLQHELLWLYLLRENRQAIAAAPQAGPQPMIIFATGHMPFRGEARFDVARWDFANYSRGCE